MVSNWIIDDKCVYIQSCMCMWCANSIPLSWPPTLLQFKVPPATSAIITNGEP